LLHIQQGASKTAHGSAFPGQKPWLVLHPLFFRVLAPTMQRVLPGEMKKMLLRETRIRAAAKTRALALGLVCVLAASGALAAVTPGHRCGAPDATTCECCHSSGTRSGHSAQGASCCDAPSAVQPAPAAAEICTSQRVEGSRLDVSRDREAISSIHEAVPGVINTRPPRAAGTHAHLLLCAFLI